MAMGYRSDHPYPTIPTDPTTATECAADRSNPFGLPLGDLWREQAALRLSLLHPRPGRSAVIGRLAAVEAALRAGGVR